MGEMLDVFGVVVRGVRLRFGRRMELLCGRMSWGAWARGTTYLRDGGKTLQDRLVMSARTPNVQKNAPLSTS